MSVEAPEGGVQTDHGKEEAMPSFAAALKDEIRRIARREINAATHSTKQAAARHRRDIAALKRLVHAQQKELLFLKTQERNRLKQRPGADTSLEGTRFSTRSVRAQRRRLGLSAADFARLVRVSPLTIYNWEHGKARPKEEHRASLVALRGMGKAEAVKKLEMLDVPKKKRGA